MRRLAATYWVFIFVPLILLSRGVSAVDWGKVAARDNRGTVLIRINWANEEGPQGGTGTGFVADKTGKIVTVAHHFPPGDLDLLAIAETEGLSTAYGPQAFGIEIVHLDREADVAILRPTEQVELIPVPIAWDWVPNEQARVMVRGFPLGSLLEGRQGFIRRNGLSREVPTDIILQAGHSGSPVYNDEGRVVGMARGGTPFANLKDDPTVMGLGFFVPLSLLQTHIPEALLASFLSETLTAVTPPSIPPDRPADAMATEMRMTFPVSALKETSYRGLHDLIKPEETEIYYRVFTAEPGYRIVRYEVAEHSANHVSDRNIHLAPDGSSLTFSFKLTSGPGYDRKRGWLDASLVTIQQAK